MNHLTVEREDFLWYYHSFKTDIQIVAINTTGKEVTTLYLLITMKKCLIPLFFLVGKLTMKTFDEQIISQLSFHILLLVHCGLKCTCSLDHPNNQTDT